MDLNIKDVKNIDNGRMSYNDEMHRIGRQFSWVAICLIMLVPVVYCVASGAMPIWAMIPDCVVFMLGYFAVGLIEAVSYAPLLGTGGQYLTFITGNISNLKLPCALNSQSVTNVKEGSEEKEIITTVSIAVCSIVTTLVIVVGLLPLAMFQDGIVEALAPISPYVIPSIFGGLTCVLLTRHLGVAIVPFVACFAICLVAYYAFGVLLGPGVMIIIGMAVSLCSVFPRFRKKSPSGKSV